MKNINILVMDRDIIVRHSVKEILERECNCTVRMSGNVRECKLLIMQQRPNLILLNIEQVRASNYSFFKYLRKHYPNLPIVVMSSRSYEGAKAAMYALANGAVDVFTTPRNNNGLLLGRSHLEKRLPLIVNKVSRRKEEKYFYRRDGSNKEENEDLMGDLVNDHDSARIIVMGSGMGGVEPVKRIIKNLPGNFPVPIVLVQHFPRYYTSVLAKKLGSISELEIQELECETELHPSTVYIAPGGFHCKVQQSGNVPTVSIHRGPRIYGERPSIDLLFQSAARLYGNRVLGIILSGAGMDGVAGAEAVINAGGDVLVQEPGDSIVGELSMKVIQEGYASNFFAADKLAGEILKRVPRHAIREKRNQIVLKRNHTSIDKFTDALNKVVNTDVYRK